MYVPYEQPHIVHDFFIVRPPFQKVIGVLDFVCFGIMELSRMDSLIRDTDNLKQKTM